jgi:dGTP triphosphohydrolase
LFELFLERATEKNADLGIFPHPFRETLVDLRKTSPDDKEYVRPVIDMIAGMTETGAVRLYQRLHGFHLGWIHDHL